MRALAAVALHEGHLTVHPGVEPLVETAGVGLEARVRHAELLEAEIGRVAGDALPERREFLGGERGWLHGAAV